MYRWVETVTASWYAATARDCWTRTASSFWRDTSALATSWKAPSAACLYSSLASCRSALDCLYCPYKRPACKTGPATFAATDQTLAPLEVIADRSELTRKKIANDE